MVETVTCLLRYKLLPWQFLHVFNVQEKLAWYLKFIIHTEKAQ